MTVRLFVGNLAYNTQESDLISAFAPYGVSDVHLPTDRATGQPRGFAFVTVDESHCQAAIRAWEGKYLAGRALTVNEAKPREDRGSGGAHYGGERTGGYGSSDGGHRW